MNRFSLDVEYSLNKLGVTHFVPKRDMLPFS